MRKTGRATLAVAAVDIVTGFVSLISASVDVLSRKRSFSTGH